MFLRMRAAWRLLRLVTVTVCYTAGVALVARFKTPDERDTFRARHQRRGSQLLCRIFRIRVQVTGPLPDSSPQLIVCNHFGILDPFALASVLTVAFAAKSEIRQWPLIGWVARVYGVIFVDRERKQAAADFIRRLRERMRARVPVLVFPEGTTSADEQVLPFKTGAFASVAGTEMNVLPIYLRPRSIDGQSANGNKRSLVTWAGGNEPFTHNLMRILMLRDIEMEIVLGSPFPASDLNRKALAEKAWNRVIALRDGSETDTFVR